MIKIYSLTFVVFMYLSFWAEIGQNRDLNEKHDIISATNICALAVASLAEGDGGRGE